jgi:hypothetical protein
MKRIALLGTLMLVILLLLLTPGCKTARFEVTAVDISPAEVASGVPAMVKADVENIGEAEGTYKATLTIDGAEVETKEVAVAPGTKETLVFSVIREAPGTYQVGVGGLASTLKVLKPAQFTVSDLIISPPEAEVGEEVIVTVSVKNVGEAEGIYAGTLKIDGMEVERKDVTVAGGSTQTLTFTVVREVGPSCNIEIDELTGTLVINVKKLLVLVMNGARYDHSYKIEGTVKNVGTVPLFDVQFAVALYEEDGSLFNALSAPVEPSTVEVGETAHCMVVAGGTTRPYTYNYGFFLPSGEPIDVTLE